MKLIHLTSFLLNAASLTLREGEGVTGVFAGVVVMAADVSAVWTALATTSFVSVVVGGVDWAVGDGAANEETLDGGAKGGAGGKK